MTGGVELRESWALRFVPFRAKQAAQLLRSKRHSHVMEERDALRRCPVVRSTVSSSRGVPGAICYS